MRINLLILILMSVMMSSCGNFKNRTQINDKKYYDINLSRNDTNDYLLRVPENDYELGKPFGFINKNNDTIIPIGKYFGTLTDTVKIFAVIYNANNEIIGVDKRGQVLFEIFKYDNGPDYIREGYFRVIRNEKIGYANKYGEIKINCQFDCAFPFEDGKAKVSNDCIEIEDFEYSKWESENWFFIDKKGKLVK